MKFLLTYIKRYLLTLLTLVLILCLTFYKPPYMERTNMIVEIDKLVHLVMYFTLCAVFWYENFKVTLKPKMRWMVIFAIVIPAAFSGAMEYLQYRLTSYRSGDFDDFVYNTIGVLSAALFSLVVTRPLMRWRNKKKGNR
ncbi:MAG: VanZ family protein [Bacteroidaceae bacterium]|nr:VanZ family protein [Bacteroidaceae bacterium]